MTGNIDLHIHSTFSDGTDTPEQIVKKLYDAGIEVFSITDHDSTGDTMRIASAASEYGLKYINGVEFSCHTVKLCHILGYNFTPDDRNIRNLAERKLDIQKNKMMMRIDKLKEMFNITFSDEDLDWLFSQPRAGKPHIAQLLVKSGYAASNQEAFIKFIKKVKVKAPELSPEQAVRAIKSAGGIAIWAHPLGGEGESHFNDHDFREELSRVIRSGIDGLEVYYSRYSKEEINYLLKIAKEYNLVVSGGSDYHGENKDIHLGELNAEGMQILKDKLTILERIK